MSHNTQIALMCGHKIVIKIFNKDMIFKYLKRSNPSIVHSIILMSILLFSCNDDSPVSDTNQYIYYNKNDLKIIKQLQQLYDIDESNIEWKINSDDNDLFYRVSSLSLNSRELDEIPEDIFNLSSLESLNLVNNNILTIPESIDQLQQLEELYISSNRLESIHESIGTLKNLQILFIYSNMIDILPESVGNMTELNYLSAEYNEITNLPSSIGNCTKLEYLNFNYNYLTTLPVSVGNLINLYYLYVEDNLITSIPDSICNIIDNIEKKRFSGNLICDPDSIPECILPYLHGQDCGK